MKALDTREKGQESFDDYLARLNLQGERGIWASNSVKLDFILKRVKSYFKPGMRVCDIGLGEGYTLNWMLEAGLDVSGIDISEFAVKYLAEKFKSEGKAVNLMAGDIASMDLEPDQL